MVGAEHPQPVGEEVWGCLFSSTGRLAVVDLGDVPVDAIPLANYA
jgi:hypothetical protein